MEKFGVVGWRRYPRYRPHVQQVCVYVVQPFLLNLFRSWPAHVADCSQAKGVGEVVSRPVPGRFAHQSRIPASFAMGFIPAITLRIYLPPPVKSPLPLDAALQLSFLRCSSCARYLASAEALNLRRIHRNQSTTRRETAVEINQSLRRQSRCRHVVSSSRAFDSHSPSSRIINPRGFCDDDASNLSLSFVFSFSDCSSTIVFLVIPSSVRIHFLCLPTNCISKVILERIELAI